MPLFISSFALSLVAAAGGFLVAALGHLDLYILPAADGDPAIGILLSDTAANDSGVSKAGTEVDVLIKDICLFPPLPFL